ncbi:MAG: ComF family protein [Clostridia bacterium]|nr:ComF family protein [Clostridia bacterium]
MKNKLKKALAKLLDGLFPPKCACCGALLSSSVSAFCPDCYREFAAARLLPCRHCGKETMHCTCCNDTLVASGIYRVAKVCPYYPERDASPELGLIFAMKRKNVKAYFRFAAREMAAAVRRMGGADGSTVTFVPRRPSSVSLYGFDHARVLALMIAEELDLPFEETFYRSAGASEQKGLTRKERRKNASSTILPVNGLTATGKRYLICDDILTTGSSLSSCASILTALGATELRAVVFAARG